MHGKGTGYGSKERVLGEEVVDQSRKWEERCGCRLGREIAAHGSHGREGGPFAREGRRWPGPACCCRAWPILGQLDAWTDLLTIRPYIGLKI